MNLDELTAKAVELEQRTKSNSHRLDRMQARQDDLDKLVQSVTALASEQEHIKEDVTEIKADVKSLTERPAKRWDAVIAAIITGVVSFVLAWALRGGT